MELQLMERNENILQVMKREGSDQWRKHVIHSGLRFSERPVAGRQAGSSTV